MLVASGACASSRHSQLLHRGPDLLVLVEHARQLAPERIRHRQNVGGAGGQLACRQRREPRQRWQCDLFFTNEMRVEDAGESPRGDTHGAGDRGGFLERRADLTVFRLNRFRNLDRCHRQVHECCRDCRGPDTYVSWHAILLTGSLAGRPGARGVSPAECELLRAASSLTRLPLGTDLQKATALPSFDWCRHGARAASWPLGVGLTVEDTVEETRYGLRIEIPFGYDRAVEHATAALKAQGFSVLTTIDVQQTL